MVWGNRTADHWVSTIDYWIKSKMADDLDIQTKDYRLWDPSRVGPVAHPGVNSSEARSVGPQYRFFPSIHEMKRDVTSFPAQWKITPFSAKWMKLESHFYSLLFHSDFLDEWKKHVSLSRMASEKRALYSRIWKRQFHSYQYYVCWRSFLGMIKARAWTF